MKFKTILICLFFITPTLQSNTASYSIVIQEPKMGALMPLKNSSVRMKAETIEIAFQWLEASLKLGYPNINWIKTDKDLEGLRARNYQFDKVMKPYLK